MTRVATLNATQPTVKDLLGICTYATAQRLLQGKWAIMIIYVLSEGPVHFNELQRRLPKINHATLSRQLKQVEADGLVERAEYEGTVQRVEYSLTEIGRKFIPVLDGMKEWSEGHIAQMPR